MFSEIQSKREAIQSALKANSDYRAASKGINLIFSLRAQYKDESLLINITDGKTNISSSSSHSSPSSPSFSLSAREEHWNELFSPIPKPPFQSFWGILRTIGPENGISVLGSTSSFATYSRIWRLLLDITRITINDTPISTTPSEPDLDPESDPEEFITGKYIHLSTLLHGNSRIFVESAGTGPQPLLLLHTAGSDSRQSHAFMNFKSLQSRFSMHAFDLPGHGRSSLGTSQRVGNLSLDEDSYIDIIRQVIQKLGLREVIVCGASMAGQICLAVALRATGLGVKGVIACEACAHIPTNPPIYGFQGADEGILNPETVCGMMSPTSPANHQREVWWGYSSQGIGVFKGDLKFYFQGWDGRGRLGGIHCPVYMLTGEYDYSCTPEMSRKTYNEIRNGEGKDMVEFEEMEGMGYFPVSEDPEKFLGYFERAVEFIRRKRT